MKNVYTLTVALLLIFTLSSCQKDDEQNKVRPNILILLTDDQRHDAIGYAGNPVLQTPTMDRLAKSGIRFDQAVVSDPICMTSRATVLTGQYAITHGVHDFETGVNLEQTYPYVMKKNGYYTGFIGKWGVDASNNNYLKKVSSLFDFWAGGTGQTSYWYDQEGTFFQNNGIENKEETFVDNREHARKGFDGLQQPIHMTTGVIPHKFNQFLASAPADQPFCMSISFKAPHSPWQDFDIKYAEALEGIEMPMGKTVSREDALKQPEFLRNSLNNEPNDFLPNHKSELKLLDDLSINGPVQRRIRAYYKTILGIDYALENIIKSLKEKGEYENTIIIFLSDNGQFLSEHGFQGKWLLHEESVRIPFFIHSPLLDNKLRGKVDSSYVSNLDVAPTVLSLAGIEVPTFMQGKDLSQLLTGEREEVRPFAYLEHYFGHTGLDHPRHIERSVGLRTKEWKFIHYFERSGKDEYFLYDLEADPNETENVYHNPAFQEKAAELKALLLDYHEQI